MFRLSHFRDLQDIHVQAHIYTKDSYIQHIIHTKHKHIDLRLFLVFLYYYVICYYSLKHQKHIYQGYLGIHRIRNNRNEKPRNKARLKRGSYTITIDQEISELLESVDFGVFRKSPGG